MTARKKKLRLAAGGLLALLAVALLAPEPAPAVPAPADAEPFVWDSDDRWAALEARFDQARQAGCAATADELDAGLDALDADVTWIDEGGHGVDDVRFDEIEGHVFATAPLVGACPTRANEFIEAAGRLRSALKRQSRSWDESDAAVRRRLYRLLYGSRTAVEEVMLQGEAEAVPALIFGTDEPSQTPSTTIHDVTIHSGDILVSRGGAPTSALIARGNDYPGNFSHIALVHVDEDGGARIIESHIEVGVVVSSVDTYLEDKKLRILVLRLAHDHPALANDPLLPHRAATAALDEARERHVPYDFEMDYDEPSKKFCSEVASAPYRAEGVHLWQGLTSMSSIGVTSWLASFGVRRFETHGPSDLEYDPQVVVVAEFRDPATLFGDHLDNAVIDAMLEGAEAGDEMGYDYRMLPFARLAKAYSATLNLFGAAGPVPEGMSATTGLRAEWLAERHAEVRSGTESRAESFHEEHGYRPPYWDLVAMAREALAQVEER